MKGSGNQLDYGMRIYDPRLSKFLSVDPLLDKYPELTPYQFANNSPIANIDLDGEENLYYSVKFNEQGKSVLKLVLEEKTLLNLFPSYYFSYGGNSYYQTDEISWLNGGMGMKMLSKFEGKTKEELDAMLSTMKTDVEVHPEYVKQHEQEIQELFQNAFLGAAAVNTKRGTFTSTATDKQQQAANNKTSSEGNKNSTTGQVSASSNKTNSVKTTPSNTSAGSKAAPIVANKANSLTSEQIVHQKLQSQLGPNEAILPKPRIYIGDGSSGKYAVPDFAVYNKNTGQFIRLVDAKDGNATLSTAQKQVNERGGVFRGSRRAKDAKPQTVGTNSIQEERTNVAGGSN